MTIDIPNRRSVVNGFQVTESHTHTNDATQSAAVYFWVGEVGGSALTFTADVSSDYWGGMAQQNSIVPLMKARPYSLWTAGCAFSLPHKLKGIMIWFIVCSSLPPQSHICSVLATSNPNFSASCHFKPCWDLKMLYDLVPSNLETQASEQSALNGS